MIVREAACDEWGDIFGELAGIPAQVFVSEHDGVRLASAAICGDEHGCFWVFLDMERPLNRRQSIEMVRAMSGGLHNTNRLLFTACNEAHASAPKLLAMLGFEPTGETRDGFPIWVWRPWPL